MAVPEDVGCSNEVCVDAPKCQRTVIWEDGSAREIKSFGGTPDKGCGKFIPRKDQEKK
jgi:hypothetical protein